MKKIDWWQEFIQIVPDIDEDHHLKMEFVRSFLKSCNVSGPDDTKICMGSVRLETLTYFLYAVITKYDELHRVTDNIRDNSTKENI